MTASRERRALIRIDENLTTVPRQIFTLAPPSEAERVQLKILILRFPRETSPEPVVCYLARDDDLTFAIVHASIVPCQEKIRVLELKGTRENVTNGPFDLKRKGIKVSRSHQEVRHKDALGTPLWACTSACPRRGPSPSHAPPWRCSSIWPDAAPVNSEFPPAHPMP